MMRGIAATYQKLAQWLEMESGGELSHGVVKPDSGPNHFPLVRDKGRPLGASRLNGAKTSARQTP
jgi:hypothetical protein